MVDHELARVAERITQLLLQQSIIHLNDEDAKPR